MKHVQDAIFHAQSVCPANVVMNAGKLQCCDFSINHVCIFIYILTSELG
jgi:hypothetical protein